MSLDTDNPSPSNLTTIAVVVSASRTALNNIHDVNARISEMRTVLKKLGFDAQTVLHCRSGNGAACNGAVVCFDDRNKAEHNGCYESLDQAVDASRQKMTNTPFAIVDLAAATSELDWRWVVDSIKTSDIACCFHKQRTIGRVFTRATKSASDQLSRLLMRTGKTESRPGIVVFRSEVFQDLVKADIQAEATEELIAYCRSDMRTIAEAKLLSSNDTHKSFVTLKPVLIAASKRLRFWWNTIAFPQRRETSPTNPDSWKSKQWLVAFGIMLLASLMFFTNLGYPLLEPDEARNAQLGLNVYQTGEWMSLMVDGDYYWDKPPLQAWMTAASYHLFGPSEFAARVPCAVTSLVCVLSILLLGSRLFGFRTASVAAIALILSGGFTVVARYITMDASLCCFATVMFLAILLATQRTCNSFHKGWLVLAGIACGMGLLVKGPVIAVIVVPPVMMMGWLQEKSFNTNPRFWFCLFAPAVLIATPWFLATSIVHPEFIEYFFWKHHVVRFADAFNHEQPWWFYLPVVLMMTYPAVFLLPQLFRLLSSSDRESRREFGSSFGPMLIYVLWIVGFFSLSEAKLPTYILPSVPILCLLMGRTVDLVLGDQLVFAPVQEKLTALPRKLVISVSVILVAIVAVAIIALSIEGRAFFVIVSVAIAACIVLVLVTPRKSSNLTTSYVHAIAAGAIFLLVCNGLLIPLISDARSSQHAIKRLSGNPDYSDAPVVYFGRPPRGTFFSVPDVNVKHFDDKCRLKAVRFLSSHPNSIVIASKNDIKTLRREMNYSVNFDPQEGHRKMFVCRPIIRQSDVGSSTRISNNPNDASYNLNR